MGNFIGQVFHPISISLQSHNKPVSEQTKKHVRVIFDALRANPRVTVQRLDGLLSQIPKVRNYNNNSMVVIRHRAGSDT